MVFVIGDIVKIGRYTGTVTRFFSDGTVGVDDNRVDPAIHRVEIIGQTLRPITEKGAVIG